MAIFFSLHNMYSVKQTKKFDGIWNAFPRGVELSCKRQKDKFLPTEPFNMLDNRKYSEWLSTIIEIRTFYRRNTYFTNEKLCSGEFVEFWEYIGVLYKRKHSKE